MYTSHPRSGISSEDSSSVDDKDENSEFILLFNSFFASLKSSANKLMICDIVEIGNRNIPQKETMKG